MALHRRATHVPTAPLSPAERYRLQVGGWADWRIKGWVALGLLGPKGEEQHIAERWQQHRDELIKEAHQYGFIPYAETGETPTGAGFDRWVAALRQSSEY